MKRRSPSVMTLISFVEFDPDQIHFTLYSIEDKWSGATQAMSSECVRYYQRDSWGDSRIFTAKVNIQVVSTNACVENFSAFFMQQKSFCT